MKGFDVKKTIPNFIFIAATLMALVSCAIGQNKTGKINGVVFDIMGNVVPDVTVVVTTGTVLKSLRTAAEGEFHIVVPVGISRVTFEVPGYSDVVKLNRVRVTSGASQFLKVVLKAKKIKYGKRPPCPEPCIIL